MQSNNIKNAEVLRMIPTDSHKRFTEFRADEGSYKCDIDLLQRYLLLAQPPELSVVRTIVENSGKDSKQTVGKCATCLQVCVINKHCSREVFNYIINVAGEREKYTLSRTVVSVMWREGRFEWMRDCYEKIDLSLLTKQELDWLSEVKAGKQPNTMYPYKAG